MSENVRARSYIDMLEPGGAADERGADDPNGRASSPGQSRGRGATRIRGRLRRVAREAAWAQSRASIVERGVRSRDWMDAIADFKAYVEQFPVREDGRRSLLSGRVVFPHEGLRVASGSTTGLIRDFPASPLHPDALFQLARCDDLQSRPAPLDQTETTRAISRYKEFIELTPSTRAPPMRSGGWTPYRPARGERWRNGRLYYRLKHYDREYYFRSVMERYPCRCGQRVAALFGRRPHPQEKVAEAVTVLRVGDLRPPT